MNKPLTLLELAGAGHVHARFSQACLLMIDFQNEYLEGALALPDAHLAVEEAALLLSSARAAETPVFHIVNQGKPGGLFDPAKGLSAIIDELLPRAGEAVVTKTLPNSFARTDLAHQLGETGRKHLIVAGFMTHTSVSATVRAALDLGYAITVVGSACASR